MTRNGDRSETSARTDRSDRSDPSDATRAHRARRRVALGLAVLLVAAGAFVTALLWPMDAARYLRAEPSAEILDRSGRLLYAFLNSEEEWRFPRELPDISPYLVRATIAAEDQRFARHAGVDPIAVARAAWQNLRGFEVVSGASTLTMQVVKQADRSSRSWWGKAHQAMQALRLERRADKDAILAAYLNGAPYGMNLIGCDAAAQRFFGKSARELTLPEAALLAGLPKAPSAYLPLDHPDEARTRRNYVLRRMRDEGYVSQADYARAVEEPLGASWHDFPALAPHLAQRLKKQARQHARVRTTLDAVIQENAERLVKQSLKRFSGQVENAAAIIVDAASASVLARVGSADFFNTPGGGQVDASRAARSPGSALKPFTYALALERNCLYPSEMLLDSTLDYGLYQPVNFDGRYRGLVSASFALRRSLNVPAVAVLDRVGYHNVYSFLKSLGFTTLRQPAAHYGLGLTIGNCEARLDEVVSAYCTLANLGEHRPLRMLADAPDAPVRRLSRGVCLSLYDMLEQPLPDAFDTTYLPSAGVTPRACWKTGTSTGLRDAWAFVFNRQYVVGVWMGNNNGKPSPRLVGATAALPLAADLYLSLPPGAGPGWPDSNSDLRDVTLCAVSGLPVSSWCKLTRHVALPREQYLNRSCDMHHPALTGGDGDLVIERWPASAKGWDLAKISAPRVMGGKKEQKRAEGLRVVTPADKSEFVLTGETRGDRVKLRASLDAESQLHWYLDARYLGASLPGKPVYLDLTPGKHTLACMTAGGSIDTVRFTVILPRASNFFSN